MISCQAGMAFSTVLSTLSLPALWLSLFFHFTEQLHKGDIYRYIYIIFLIQFFPLPPFRRPCLPSVVPHALNPIPLNFQSVPRHASAVCVQAATLRLHNATVAYFPLKRVEKSKKSYNLTYIFNPLLVKILHSTIGM